jgi:hypothetical protein
MTEPTIDDFRDRTGAVFRLPEGGVSLELVEVEAHGNHSFSVLFHGPADSPLPQGTFTFERDGESSKQLFIVPVGPSADRAAMVYEAVFASVV